MDHVAVKSQTPIVINSSFKKLCVQEHKSVEPLIYTTKLKARECNPEG